MTVYRVTYFRTTTERVSKIIEADTADEDELFELARDAEEDDETLIKDIDCDCDLESIEEVTPPVAT